MVWDGCTILQGGRRLIPESLKQANKLVVLVLYDRGFSTLTQTQQEGIFQILDNGPRNIQPLQQASCPENISPVHGKSNDRRRYLGPTGQQCPQDSVEGEGVRKVQGDKSRRSNPPNHEGKFNNTLEVYFARNVGPYRSESVVHMVGTRPMLVSNDAIGIVTVIGLH